MTLFPKTLSKCMREELYPASQYANPDQLLHKLKTKPRMLLAFFEQACMSCNFVKNHNILVSKIIYEINAFFYSNTLSFEEVAKAFSLFIKFKNNLVHFFPTDLTLNDEGNTYNCSRFIFMIECSTLKLKWMNDPGIKIYPLKVFASELSNIDEFKYLYNTLFNHEFTFFNTVSNDVLFKLAIQSEAWGYMRGSLEFQSILCRRLFNLVDLLTFYGRAKSRCLSIVESHCQNALDKYEYCYSKEKVDAFYIATQFKLDDEVFNDLKPLQRLHFAEQYYNEKFDPKLACPGFLERIELAFDSSGMVSAKRIATRDPDSVINTRNALKDYVKRLIDRSTVNSIVFDGRLDMGHESIIGMVSYFYNMEHISFYYYKSINSDWFKNLVTIVPHLKLLRIKGCLDIDDKVIILISTFLRELSSLILSNVNLSSDVFKHLLSIPSLNHLSLQKSSLKIEGFEKDRFEKLKYLDISGSTCTINDLKYLLQACENVNILIVEKVANFHLDLIVYPEKILELGVDSEQLNQFIEKEGDKAFDRFNNLNRLYLSGKPCDSLKSLLKAMMNRMRIQFKTS